jgi:hypothetical protein
VIAVLMVALGTWLSHRIIASREIRQPAGNSQAA